MLLRRHKSRVVSVVERVAGLQAQVPRPPFIGLWSRIEGFQRADLVKAIDQREIVRGTLMRATIHLVSRDDYIEWRPTIQPVLTRLMNTILRKALHKFDFERIVALAAGVERGLVPVPGVAGEAAQKHGRTIVRRQSALGNRQ